MPESAKEAWNDVGERFTTLGRHVADRYQAMGADAAERARESQRGLEETAHELSEQLSRAFAALGETFRDERAKTELKETLRAVGDAIALSVDETVDAVRRTVGSHGSSDDADDTAA
jgi:hypothetical protein